MRKASTEGIAIQGQQGSRLLPEQLLTEAFILSDLFDIGELAALELLLAGKNGWIDSSVFLSIEALFAKLLRSKNFTVESQMFACKYKCVSKPIRGFQSYDIIIWGLIYKACLCTKRSLKTT